MACFNYAFQRNRGRVPSNEMEKGKRMMDLIFIGIVVLFFVASGFYVRFCEKL